MQETQTLIVNENEDVDAIIRKNNYKLTADKIKQILSKVLNDPSQSAKRWIWELMQNAKDVKNTFGQVSVEIEVSENELIFRHNGDPFKMTNITGLIQQVSSKDSDNADESVTGKFGTGFIATHLLADIITVNGIVNHKNAHRDFEVILDRSGRTSEELLPKIETALERIRTIETNPIFSIRNDYDVKRAENDYDTTFKYELLNDEKKKAAKDGITDLENTLPLTLVNVPKIKSVKIIDKISNNSSEYKREDVSDDGKIRKTKIELSKDDIRCFITYYNQELSLSAEVNNFEELKLIENFGKVPNLYRDFPLIGSDKFYFPFILNGFKLHPTEDRDGIPIHSESAPDHIENRELIESAFSAAKEFTNYLIDSGAKNLFVCAYSRLPNEKWQSFSKDWYQKLQENYRSFLNEKALIETDVEVENKSVNIDLNKAFIPNYGENEVDKLAFYEIVKSFIGSKFLPKSEILIKWIKASGPKDELESWGRALRYALVNLLTELQVVGSIKCLSEKLEGTLDPIDWLNNLYAFLINYKETDSFKDYAIIPNQDGNFQKLSPDSLHLEDTTANIPDEFLDILNDLGDNWRAKLIHRGINLPGQNIEKKGLVLVSQRINELIKVEEFRKSPNSFKIIKDILRNTTSFENIDNFKNEIFLKGKELLHFDEAPRIVSNIKDFRFKNALEIFIETINLKIQELGNITVLAEQLKIENDQAVVWLNKYLNRLKGNTEFADKILFGNIVPNRYENFCAFEDLNNFGTTEAPLDEKLIKILLKLDASQDWNKELVLDGIDVGCVPRSFNDLGSAVDNAIREIEKEEAVQIGFINPYKETIIELIEWCNANDERNFSLNHFMQRKNDLWVKFSMTDKIFSLIRDKEALAMLAVIQDSGISKEQLNDLLELFPNGIPDNVMKYAKEDARKKKEFSNLLEVGSKVERLFIETLQQFEVSSEIIHAGGGAYDIRVHNTHTNKSFYIEIKSCRYQNVDPINIAVSQAKRAVKELEKGSFGIVVIERSSNNEMDQDYIRANTKYLRNPGKHLSSIGANFDMIKQSSNTDDIVDLRMENAEFKGALDYKWLLAEIGDCGFKELIDDINRVIV